MDGEISKPEAMKATIIITHTTNESGTPVDIDIKAEDVASIAETIGILEMAVMIYKQELMINANHSFKVIPQKP